MQEYKRRPTLDELKEMPVGLLRMEIAQLVFDAGLADNAEVHAEAELLIMDPDPQPERIVELWNQLRSGTGSTRELGRSRATVSEQGPLTDSTFGRITPEG